MERKILTQRDMCDLSDTEIGTMSRYLCGKKMPTLRSAKRIAELCNVPIDIFLDKKVQMQFLGKSFLKEDIDWTIRPRRILNEK